MGGVTFHLFILVITLHLHVCNIGAAADKLNKGTSSNVGVHNNLSNIFSNFNENNFSNIVHSVNDSNERNVNFKVYLNPERSDEYITPMLDQSKHSRNLEVQNTPDVHITPLSVTSGTDSYKMSWSEMQTSLSISFTVLSHLSFFFPNTSTRTRSLEQDNLHISRDQRSISKRSRSDSSQIQDTKSLKRNNNTYSHLVLSNTSFSWSLDHSDKHTLEGINPDRSFVQKALSDEGNSVYTTHSPRHTLYIGGLFELSGTYPGNGYSELDAALLAVSHINDHAIIPGYKLELLYNDSKCDPGVGTDVLFDFIYRKSKDVSLTMIMGSSCTEVTKTIAEIVPYWNLLLISYAATSPALSEREKYRTFFRLALGDSSLNPARRMLIKNFLWDKVAALYEDLESMSLAFNGISKEFASHGIVFKFSTSFKDASVEIPGQLKDIKELDVRIIIAGFSETTARQVFCEIYKQGMYGPRYVWVLVGGYKRQWWKEEQAADARCSQLQLAAAVEKAFTVLDFNGLLADSTALYNPTSSEFLAAYSRANSSVPISIHAPSTYDTVWAVALTIRQALQEWTNNGTALLLHQLRYEDMTIVKETFINTMEKLEFLGVSGPVSFKGSDREGVAVVYQIQDGNLTQVAIHQPTSISLDFNCESCSKISWQGGRVPKDELVVVVRLKTIEKLVFYVITSLCVGGVILAVLFLCYNLYHGRLKFIKLSSPKLNNVAVIGCILVYMAVIMLGFDDRILTDDSFPIVCSGRAFLLAAGFSLAFGAMFAKTFRVHQIFTRTHHGLVKSKLIQDTHLLVIIGVLLAVDSVMVFVWVVADPMSRKVTNITKQVSADDEDLIFQEQLATCHSNHLQKWLGAFYAYKGLLLIFGVYMAWETRHVKIPALNDSRYIGLNVYNVVIMSVSVVVISNILSSQPTLLYAVEASFMLLSTTVTLCLLFVPKIYVIVTSGGNPIIASMGIVVDHSNTRRFVFDDRKEIYYRAEVQNRVYKRELVELDQQIARLERLLEIPLTPYPMLTEELLYLLPESKVDGTPRCLKRYRRDLERCNSISDGGEGVVFDISETEDILMDMTFTSLNQKSLTNKRHSSVETCKSNNSTTLQQLTRSLSISGSGGRGRKWKKGRVLVKSSTPFCLTESNFLSKKNKIDTVRADQIYRGIPNSYSDGMSYLYSEKSTNFITSSLDFGKSAPVSVHDKITQTSSDSICNVHSSINENSTSDNTIVCADMNKDKRENAGSSYKSNNEDNLFFDTSNYIHPQLFSSNKEKLFAVHRIQVESLDDDSNSNSVNGDDSEEETKNVYLSKSGEISLFHNSDGQDCKDLQQERFNSKITADVSSGKVNYCSMPFRTPQEKQMTSSHGLIVQTPNELSRCSCLSAHELPEISKTLQIKSSGRQRSSSTPNPPISTPVLYSSESTPATQPISLHTTNNPSLALKNSAPYPVCLNHCCVHCQPKPHTSTKSSSLCNVNSNTFKTLHILSHCDERSSMHESATPSKRANSNKSHNIPLPSSTLNISSFKTGYVKGKKNPSSTSSEDHSSVHIESFSKPVISSLRDCSLNPSQIYPSDGIHNDICTAYQRMDYKMDSSLANHRNSTGTPSISSEGISGLETRVYHLPKSLGIKCTNVNSTKQVLQAERRRKIQKLQVDLVKIQQELQDLNNLEHDFSEV